MLKRLLSSAAVLTVITATPASAEEGFYQEPSARGDVLIFASEGDLWRSARTGGTAMRLTSHEEAETDVAVSPDGTMVAFTASYDSTRDVYVMPTAGGAPRRLTFQGGGLKTIGWTPDGKVIFSSRMTGAGQAEILHTVDPNGGNPTAIPLWRANDATYGTDGKTLFFSRRGLAARARDNAVLYRGGGMAQLWRWQTGSQQEAVQLLGDFGAPIRIPMAHGGRVYFISDKSGSDAIWSVAEDGSGVAQHSEGLPFPVLQASMDGGDIFLQNGADIHVFATGSNTLSTLSIDIITDREQTRQRALQNPMSHLQAARISPSGESVAVTARGRVALGAPKQLRRVEYNIPLDARAREAVAGPDREWTYLLLEQGTRGDLHRMAADGSGSPEPVTRNYGTYIWSFVVAPDGKTIIVRDKLARLQKVDVETGRTNLLSQNQSGADDPFSGVTFSPDGKFIAYAEQTAGRIGNTSDVYVQNLATGNRVKATSSKYNDYAPAFAHDGAWLYFISDRNFDPTPGHPWGDRHMGVAFPDPGEIHALQLDPEAEFRFVEANELTRSDDDDSAGDASSSDSGSDSDDSDEDEGDSKEANIVLSGLAQRLYKLPTKPGASNVLLATEEHLYTFNDDNVVSIAIDKSDPETETFAKDARGVSLSADRKTLLVLSGSPDKPSLALVPAKAKMPEKPASNMVRLGDWRLTIDPAAEWQQMFVDAWRLHRDFAYDPTLRGVDWNAVRTQHEPLLSRIGHRSELNTILAQMGSQLGILHSQVRAGDLPEDQENSEMAFLGARYTPVSGGLRVDSIYDAEADLVALRPPLRRPGVDTQVGDVIRKVDGTAIASLAELRMALASKAGQQVRLDLNRRGRPISTIVEPMNWRGEYTANYMDFVEKKRDQAQQMSGGDIGYMHLRAMGPGDIASFARDYFAQLDKDGLIIDVRNNGGGNIDSILISMLQRRAWAFWTDPAGKGVPTTNMQNAFRGHVAVLIDERTYSDGESFAAGMKSLGLAPLVGTRTAGAGIWLSDRSRVADNGGIRIGELAQYGADGSLIIEGYGVGPDYEVENPPFATFQGQDAQLQAAIALLQQKIAAEPIKPLTPRPLPPLGTPAGDITILE
ncbi:MAG: S41 family peptidase [Erythrobacter sp.]